MLQHYITVALRNLLKNKGQTLISVIGLAVGLFCFALCTYLIRYWINEDNEFKNKKGLQKSYWYRMMAILYPELPHL